MGKYIDDFGTGAYFWRYDGQSWHKQEGVFGPLAINLQKNLLAVDSLFYLVDNSYGILRFRIVVFNGLEFVRKWYSKVPGSLGWIVLAHIAQDSKGNLWISYYCERYGTTYGIVCNNTKYNTLDGLADDNIRGITPDESGTVWCATDGGISRYNGTGWVSYDTTDGVASNRIYKILIGKDKTLYAATSKGISVLKSNRFKTLKTTHSGKIAAERHRKVWDSKDNLGQSLPSGIYIARLKSESFSKSIRMFKVK